MRRGGRGAGREARVKDGASFCDLLTQPSCPHFSRTLICQGQAATTFRPLLYSRLARLLGGAQRRQPRHLDPLLLPSRGKSVTAPPARHESCEASACRAPASCPSPLFRLSYPGVAP
jgi:hypothetical protein